LNVAVASRMSSGSGLKLCGNSKIFTVGQRTDRLWYDLL